MKKIKIIEASIELGLGGTEYVIQLYSKYLNKERFEVTVVGLNGGGKRVKLIEQYGVRVVVLNGDFDKLAALLSETDVFHWHGSGIMQPNLLATLKANKPKLVLQTNVLGLYYHSPLYDLIDYDLYVSKMILIRRMKEDLYLSANFANKRKTLYNPVDTEAMNQMSPTDEELRQFKSDYQLLDKFIVGRIGRADDIKFDPITLQGFADFATRTDNARFLLVGATPKIIEEAKSLNILDRLLIFDTTSDLKQLLYYYHTIDVFLAASIMGESFGLVIAEAMSMGIPVITVSTPHCDNAQIELVDNEKTGLVVNQDPKNIGQAISFLYHNSKIRKRYGTEGRAKVQREYNANRIIASLENLIYSHLLLNSKNRAKTLIHEFDVSSIYNYTKRLKNLWTSAD